MVEVIFSMLFAVACISTSIAFIQQKGVWHVAYDKNQILGFPNTMYNGTTISVKISCRSEMNYTRLRIRWVMRYSVCANEYESAESYPGVFKYYLNQPLLLQYRGMEYENVEYIKRSYEHGCNGSSFLLQDYFAAQSAEEELVPDKLSRKIDPFNVVKTWKDGSYIFILSIEASDDIKADVTVQMLGPYGYISAVEWPLLVFYGVIGLIYIVYGLVWTVLLACNRRELLCLHYWIGGVIFIGIMEKAVFFAKYQRINYTGESGALIVTEIISCLKRATARMLVITVSSGFGIVKPRSTLCKVLCIGLLYFVAGTVEGCIRSLNPKSYQDKKELLAAVPLVFIDGYICCLSLCSLRQTTRKLRVQKNKVKLIMFWLFTLALIFLGLAAFLFLTSLFLAIVLENLLTPKSDQDKNELLAAVPLILFSLRQTTRTLRVQKNKVKLSMFWLFTLALIFLGLAAIILLTWLIVQIRIKDCVKDWQIFWLDEAIWQLFNSIILIIIMILWRPTTNNQRMQKNPNTPFSMLTWNASSDDVDVMALEEA